MIYKIEILQNASRTWTWGIDKLINELGEWRHLDSFKPEWGFPYFPDPESAFTAAREKLKEWQRVEPASNDQKEAFFEELMKLVSDAAATPAAAKIAMMNKAIRLLRTEV